MSREGGVRLGGRRSGSRSWVERVTWVQRRGLWSCRRACCGLGWVGCVGRMEDQHAQRNCCGSWGGVAGQLQTRRLFAVTRLEGSLDLYQQIKSSEKEPAKRVLSRSRGDERDGRHNLDAAFQRSWTRQTRLQSTESSLYVCQTNKGGGFRLHAPSFRFCGRVPFSLLLLTLLRSVSDACRPALTHRHSLTLTAYPALSSTPPSPPLLAACVSPEHLVS